MFKEWFGISRSAAVVLALLYHAGGALLPRDRVVMALRTTPGSLSVFLVILRQALDSEAVDCERKRGYRLTEVGMAECRAALWTMVDELTRAAA